MGLLKSFKKLVGKGADAIAGNYVAMGREMADFIKGRYPEKMSEQEAADVELKMMEISNKYAIHHSQMDNEQQNRLYDFIIKREGTAQEMLQMPILGRIALFLKSLIRPVVTCIVVLIDIKIYSGSWRLEEISVGDPDARFILALLLLFLNIIVLSFYFGERTARNIIIPIIDSFMDRYFSQMGTKE